MSDSSAILRTITHKAPLSMGFPKQESWSGLPFPSPGDLPSPEIESVSPALIGEFFTTESPGKPFRTGSHSSLHGQGGGALTGPGTQEEACLLLQGDLGRGDQHRKRQQGPKPHWVIEVMA